MDYITQHNWLPLKKETRDKLKEIFFIPSTGMIEVVTDEFGKGTIKQDGFTNADLRVVTVDKLVNFLGSAAINETIYDLWKRAVDKIEYPTGDGITLTGENIVITKEIIKQADSNTNTADNQLKCDKCQFTTGSARGLKIHSAKHRNKNKVA